jgi:drug/metabolite transporter (DMT)-like permease
MPSPPHRGAALLPYLLLSLAALFWSGNFVVARAVHERIPPAGLAFWRWAVALAILLPLARRGFAGRWRPLARAWRVVVPLGILGVGNFNLFVYAGLHETTATNALLLQSACPAFIVALAAATGSGRPSARQLAGIATSLAGVVTILTRGAPGALSALALTRGDLWVLAAVLSWAIYTLLLARRPPGVEPLALLTALVLVGVAWIAPFYAWELARGRHMTIDATTGASVLYVAVFASVLAYLLWNEGVARVGAERAGAFLHLMPAFGSLLAVALLGESLRLFHLAGFTLILGGVYLAGVARSPPSATSTGGPAG